MNLAFSLRVLADLCYYVFAISSVVTCARHSGLMLAGPLFGALAAYFVAMAGLEGPEKTLAAASGGAVGGRQPVFCPYPGGLGGLCAHCSVSADHRV